MFRYIIIIIYEVPTCAWGKSADQLCILSKYVFDNVHVVPFLTCMAGVRNFKNVLLINQKIYVHGWVFVCYQYRGILYCNALPAFSLRDASCNVIDIEIMCRTFGSVIVVLFPICSFARNHDLPYSLTVFSLRSF